jgi:hypothetical protein
MNHQEEPASAPYEARPAGRAPEPAAYPAAPPPRREYYDDPRRKSPKLALILSGMPGLGQVYVGFYQQGFVNALIVATVIAILSANVLHRLHPLFGLFLAFYWLYNMVDAWRRAVFYNNALAGIGPATLPEDFTIGLKKGSAIGGIALVLVGVVMLSNTLFNVPLDWLEHWWPVAFIAIGAWLIYPALVGSKKSEEPPQQL